MSTVPPLRFRFERTFTNSLPVYTEHKKHPTPMVYTIVRKYVGNEQDIKKELEKLLPGANITIKVGHLRIKGNHVREVKRWLEKMGF